MTPRIVTPPAAEPITLDEAKRHLRIRLADTTHDEVLPGLIRAARSAAENFMQRALVQRTLRATLDAFPAYGGPILLPFSPVQSVDFVKYYNSDGTLTTWAAGEYLLETDGEPAQLLHHPSYYWPTSLHAGRLGAVQVQYVAGYTPGTGSPTDYAENIPDDIKAAIKLILGDLFENREDTVVGSQPASLPRGAHDLMWPYRILRDC